MREVNKPLVSVIVVTWNAKKYLKDCLNSILNSSYSNFEIIVVDNASFDGSIEMVEKYYPMAKIIKNSSNIGFNKGANKGAKIANGDILFFLNDDAFIDENCLKEIATIAKNPQIGIIGCMMYFPDSKLVQSAGFKLLPTYHSKAIGSCQEDYGQFNGLSEVDYVSGAAIAVKTEIVERGGLFDAIGISDLEICLKARMMKYSVIILPSAKVYHWKSISFLKSFYKSLYKSQINRIATIIKFKTKRDWVKWILYYEPYYLFTEFLSMISRSYKEKSNWIENLPTTIKHLYLKMAFGYFPSLIYALFYCIVNFKNIYKKRQYINIIRERH
ncbi:MAG: glycosyltransferase family 2 protein [Candidatus Odinarchaeia archaeon]